jgi:hypothetical protein
MAAPPKNRNAAPAGTGNRVECLSGKINTDHNSESQVTGLAVRKIADRYHLSLAVAGVVCTLAGIGRRAA